MSELTTPSKTQPRRPKKASSDNSNSSAAQAVMIAQTSVLPLQRHNDLYQKLVVEFVVPRLQNLGVNKAMETLNQQDLEQLYVLSHIATSVFEASAAKQQQGNE